MRPQIVLANWKVITIGANKNHSLYCIDIRNYHRRLRRSTFKIPEIERFGRIKKSSTQLFNGFWSLEMAEKQWNASLRKFRFGHQPLTLAIYVVEITFFAGCLSSFPFISSVLSWNDNFKSCSCFWTYYFDGKSFTALTLKLTLTLNSNPNHKHYLNERLYLA